jgi:hypothetical protein
VPDGYDPNRTLGPEVAAVATLAGFPPDPEQRFCLDVSFALDKWGRFLVFETVLVAPRQNLKTGFEKQRALGKLFVCDRPLGVWSSHEFDTSRRALLDVEAMIDSSDILRKRVRLTARGKVASHGAVPEIVLKSGATLAFRTRTAGGGAGLTGDDLAVDEAWAAQSGQMGVILPIMLARPNSQVDFLSSACRPESVFLWDLVQRGRAGGGPRMFYAEWCAPPPSEVCDLGEKCDHKRATAGCGCDKPDVIVLAHSAVTRGRIELETVADLRRTMPEDEFPREIMGWHDEPDAEMAALLGAWIRCADAESKATGYPVFGIDVSPRSRSAAIVAVTARPDGMPHVEVVEHAPGTGWVVARCDELETKNRAASWVLDPGSPASILLPGLADKGIVPVQVTGRQMGQACEGFAATVAAHGLRHLGDPALTAAVAGAVRRDIGDGLWAWSRRKSDMDICPLVAATLAVYGSEGLGPDDVYIGGI